MESILIKNGALLTNGKFYPGVDVLIDDKKILKLGTSLDCREDIKTIDASDKFVSPGFIDLQVNGGGHIFFTNNITRDKVLQIYKAHQKCGTLYMLPTLITADLQHMIMAIESVKRAMMEEEGILGLHLEGPWLNPLTPGAHDQSQIRRPDDEEIETILRIGEGVIKKITIAPERFKDYQINKLLDAGLIVSAGHSNASFEEATGFFNKGVTCVTHLFNAMSPFAGKTPGLQGAALLSDVYAGIIADGFHVHSGAIMMAYRLKAEKLFLVSDASFTDVSDLEKVYIGNREVQIMNGKIYTAEGNLAGSSITLSEAVKNCFLRVGISPAEAVRMATLSPAKLLGLQEKIGQIKEG
ncbi:MAG TPA: N-acetylglucosamine-6-phosphate deacetylase, partial [Anditalea sp.]|nr:N-acetylglucosamine-6-phosphate deacetylase [Anditalea sp.]